MESMEIAIKKNVLGESMINSKLAKNFDRNMKILCIGAHSDDIEIGCGGTILKLLSVYPNCDVTWIVFSAVGPRREEALTSANFFLKNVTDRKIITHDFKDGYFPYHGSEIKLFIEVLKETLSPDLIFTHYRNDRHQDHKMLSDLVWNTFRNHLIFEYEIMKYDGDIGNPNLFVHLDMNICQNKVSSVIESFTSQSHHQWFTHDTFWSLLRLRGIECNALDGYAEGFYCRKLVLEL